MRDPNRISQILEELQRIWQKYPDLRLGQLLGNASDELILYYVEDDDLIAQLKKFDGQMQDQKDSI